MKSHFFAYLMRMKNIKRWGLMKNSEQENIKEHSLDVALIAHSLAIISRDIYSYKISPESTAVRAMYHDISEVITGDLATPIKYFNPDIKHAYKHIEQVAQAKLYSMVPEEISSSYAFINDNINDRAALLIKAADKISAYFKCIEEEKAGNMEFVCAKNTIFTQIEQMGLEEVKYFMDIFAESISLTLDELN